MSFIKLCLIIHAYMGQYIQTCMSVCVCVFMYGERKYFKDILNFNN